MSLSAPPRCLQRQLTRVVAIKLRMYEELLAVEAAMAPLLGQAPPPVAEEYLGSIIVAAHG